MTNETTILQHHKMLLWSFEEDQILNKQLRFDKKRLSQMKKHKLFESRLVIWERESELMFQSCFVLEIIDFY